VDETTQQIVKQDVKKKKSKTLLITQNMENAHQDM
jgi:hypothetical protein